MTDDGFREVLDRLGAAQKGRARGAPGYSLYVNRPLGRVLAALCHVRGMTPNQVTGVSASCTLLGLLCIAAAPSAVWTGVVVAGLLVLGYALDSADGQVARLMGGGSVAGEWLDHFVDSGKVVGVHLAVLVGLYRGDLRWSPAWLLIPIGFAVVAVMTFFGMILNDLLKGARGIPSAVQRGGSSPLRSLLLVPTDYGLLCLLFFLWGWQSVFMVAYAALFVACTAFLLLAATKWFREMRSFGGPA